MKLALRPKARILRRAVTATPMLVYPERALELNASAAEVVELIDGTRSLDQIVDALVDRHPDTPRERLQRDVARLVDELGARALIETMP